MVTLRAAVIGHPIQQSLSPRLHRRWIANYGIEATFEAVDGQSPEGFRAWVAGMADHDFVGCSVTIPFKGEALAIADRRSEAAMAIGAANLLVRTPTGLLADNTDGVGFAAAAAALPLGTSRQCARVIGAGGAAPAIVWALKSLGYKRVEITNRSPEKARLIADRFDIEIIDWAARSSLEAVDLLVNSTAAGMKGQPPLDIEVDSLPKTATVIDIVTTPARTPLLRAAEARGLPVANGLSMLVHQAIPAFAAWFGPRPDDAEEALAYLEERTGA
ncbi:shikimate/quinate 5-dehydrogenase [Parvularcula bermudensis HTCC2503]|uniref:Shikimate dehydrogenase (NADP(+)) n=1 Tax=Parvularcula bermudensis (strain ATCC BAA-594 / HTCC2503 / KCTC 12087) TaxID=314260 RepID=E0TER7_PARBH|nr:shikimate dehydrogenase [Parvularcula bermudensis]ADM08950.1 shikimate/quinate 5-dehydrogenase [Parvularcula bermudensis HTCC2503]